MKIKFIGILSVVIIFFSCKKQQENNGLEIVDKKDSNEIKEKDISKLNYVDYILDPRVEDIVINWVEYAQLQDVISKLKKGDLSFFNDNHSAIKKFLNNLESTIPPELNTPSVLARFAAFETKVFKLESLSGFSATTKPELLAGIKELLVGYSNLSLQMNKKIEADNIIIERP